MGKQARCGTPETDGSDGTHAHRDRGPPTRQGARTATAGAGRPRGSPAGLVRRGRARAPRARRRRGRVISVPHWTRSARRHIPDHPGRYFVYTYGLSI